MRGFIGQRRVAERLGENALRGDVAHAYLFSGPRSIGKRTAAVRLAQTLNCTAAGRVAGGCGSCVACRKIERGTHPDVRAVEKLADLRDIGIEQVREMQQDLALRPLEGRRRVVLIDDAADLNEFGQDALLKTLEEPPAHAVLILITARPEMIHDTIRSRAQPIPFRLVPDKEMTSGLAERLGAAAETHAAAAGGRPGIAMTLATDARARSARTAVEAELYRLVASGLTDRFAWAADLADDGDARRRSAAIGSRLDEWGELLRDAVVAGQAAHARLLRPDRGDQSRRLGASVPRRDLVDTALLVQRLRRDLAWNANARSMLELFVLRLPFLAGLDKAA
ncbi:MAG: ATP-binding protein [Candidatus Limnocylindria bacterium]